MALGKLDKKAIKEHVNGYEIDEATKKKMDEQFDSGMACCDKDDCLGRVHPNKKLV